MSTQRLTTAQALIKFLVNQYVTIDGVAVPLVAGCWGIFGHGNVTGMGEALHHVRESLPTLRGHNEQAMGHAAVAYAKAQNRRRVMAVTTSIGPGATNLATAAGLAHVNRLPVLFLPGDVFASRRPDPVLQQVEDFGDATTSANDALRPVSRFFDRIQRPEQILTSLPQAMRVLTDPADCGPVTLALCQDVQAEAYDFPSAFFTPRYHDLRRPGADTGQLAAVAEALKSAEKPLVVAGGGVHYSLATADFDSFVRRHNLPVAETQAGKGALPWDHPWNMGSIGVTGSTAANDLAAEADLVLAVGSRLQDFITGSRAVFKNPAVRFAQLNVQPFDSVKHNALALVADVQRGVGELSAQLGDWQVPAAWAETARQGQAAWHEIVTKRTAPDNAPRPSDGQVLGAVNRQCGTNATLVCAAGGLPGELHKLWRAAGPGHYHLEYGYSCMGYEIAGGLGVKLAKPETEVHVMVGDGSYLMLNSELATSVMLGAKLIVTLLDNRGYGSIHRLQTGLGNDAFNNLLDRQTHQAQEVAVDFAAHAQSLGAIAWTVEGVGDLENALAKARETDRTTVIVIKTDPDKATPEGGHWWDVPVAEVSADSEVRKAREDYEAQRRQQKLA